MTTDLHYKSLLDVSHLIKRGEASCTEVVSATLERIDAFDTKLKSFCLVTRDSAMADAHQADAELAKGLWRGPLHGVPIGIKDLLDIEGLPTTGGTTMLKNNVANADATAVERLKRAGAIVVGKVHMTEGATLAHHPDLARPDNPWKSGYWPGISSSGSGVSVAAGLCYGALGSDTAGSIRMPSYACGLSGIKPTYGRVSRHGVFPLAESLDHIGPMCRTVADAAAMLQVMGGRDPADITALSAPVPNYASLLEGGVSGLRIGVDWTMLEDGVDPAVVASLRSAADTFAALGARIFEVTLPPLGPSTNALMPLMMTEINLAHAETFPSRADEYGPLLRHVLQVGSAIGGVDVARAVQARALWTSALSKVFDDIDVLLLPAAVAPTPTWREVEDLYQDIESVVDRISRYMLPFNASGGPALSLPCGMSSNGLPLGMQLVGPHLAEGLLFRVGHAFQQATDYHTRHPDLQ